MQHRRYSFFPSALAAALLAAAGACSKVPGTEPKTHTVALDARDTAVAIDANVAVGSHVRFAERTGDDNACRVTARA